MQIKGLQLALVTCSFLAILPAQRAVAENADGNGFPQFVLDYDPSSVAMTNDHQCEYWPQTYLERWRVVAWRIIGDWRKLDRPDKIEILRQLCTFRQANLDALAYGTLLDELRFAEPVSSQTYEWLGRRPHYRLFDKNFKLPPSSFATMPDVIGNWWRTDKGEIVLLAANLTGEEQTVQYRPFGAPPDAPNATATFAPHELRRI